MRFYNLRPRKNGKCIPITKKNPITKNNISNNVQSRYNLRPRKRISINETKEIRLCIWHSLKSYKSRRNDPLVTASETKNYMLNDKILDLIRYKKQSKGNYGGKLNVLCKKGNIFEEKIINEIKNIVQLEQVISEYNPKINLKKESSKTLKLMLKGIPVIAQAPLYHNNSKTCGIADLLVRSDYLEDIIKKNPIPDDEQYKKASKLNGDYHYVVIDIKWSSLPLCSNGELIRNSGRYSTYKSQLAVYNLCLGEMQGYYPSKCYILGKGYVYSRVQYGRKRIFRSYNSFDRLGIVDYNDFDNRYIEGTLDAIKWNKHVKKIIPKWISIHHLIHHCILICVINTMTPTGV